MKQMRLLSSSGLKATEEVTMGSISKTLVKGGVVFAGILLWFTQSAYGAKEANTIDELVAMYDDSACAECHSEIYEQWAKSWHANPINSSLKGMRNFIKIGLAKEWKTDLTKAQVLKCLDCHAPVVNFASEKLAVEIGEMIVTAFEKKGTPQGDAASKELAKINDWLDTLEAQLELAEDTDQINETVAAINTISMPEYA